MAALPEKHDGRSGSATRPPVGLLLSIGDTTTSKSGKEIPTRIDWFRPKEGQLDQYAAAAATFVDVYGEQPKQLDDVYLLSNNIVDVLEIRTMAWGASGPRIVGDTNFAALPVDEWEERAFAFDDAITFWPLDASEVPQAMRDTWEGAPMRDRLNGPDDYRIEKYKIGVEATLSFCLPKVMGFGTVAQITTKGKRSMRNLVSSLRDQHTFFQGQLIGIPFRLAVRPARGKHFDRAERRYMLTQFFELVLDTPFTVQEAIDAIRERREALGAGHAQIGRGTPEAIAFTKSLALPAATDENQHIREEPAADIERPDDALLNRLAELEQKVGDGAYVTLKGLFGVDAATDLNQADAERYEQILARAGESIEDGGEVEIVEGDENIDWPGEPPS